MISPSIRRAVELCAKIADKWATTEQMGFGCGGAGARIRALLTDPDFEREIAAAIAGSTFLAGRCQGSWDYNGDYFRCACGTQNTTGECMRAMPTSINAALASQGERSTGR